MRPLFALKQDGCKSSNVKKLLIMRGSWRWRHRGKKLEKRWKGAVRDLVDRSKNILSDLEKRIKFARRKLEECRRMPISSQSVDRESLLIYRPEKLED